MAILEERARRALVEKWMRAGVTFRDAATTYITQRVNAAFPGAPKAVRALHAAGYVLHTASVGSSRDLPGYLPAAGVRDGFRPRYGADLDGLLRSGPEA